jgi:DNA-binding NtrC family response regulator
MAERILVVDDDRTIRTTLAEMLAKRGYDAWQAEDGTTALDLARKHAYGLVLLDIRLPDIDGLEVLRQLRELDEGLLVVVMTAYPEARTAVSALKAGAYDYLNKPFDLEDVRELVKRAFETQRLRTEVERLRARVGAHGGDLGELEGMIGASPAFLSLVEMTRRIAGAGRTPVLIRGESGVGKERVAQAVHTLSARAAGPWVTLNCSAISEGLLESEMFGHEKGAFTDAKQGKRGLFELADGGTLFLDEVGDLSPALQPKLLRALETQTFRRVGGSREISVDVRFVAATNRDLPALVKAGRFREDLYYRLNVAGIDVPALRQRRPDILPLARHFLEQAARVLGVPRAELDADSGALLEGYAWPGNVRELRNVMERALILAGSAHIRPEHLPKELFEAPVAAAGEWPGGLMTLDEVEKQHILYMLERCKGNKTRTAERLGIARITLRGKLKLYGIADESD